MGGGGSITLCTGKLSNYATGEVTPSPGRTSQEGLVRKEDPKHGLPNEGPWLVGGPLLTIWSFLGVGQGQTGVGRRLRLEPGFERGPSLIASWGNFPVYHGIQINRHD